MNRDPLLYINAVDTISENEDSAVINLYKPSSISMFYAKDSVTSSLKNTINFAETHFDSFRHQGVQRPFTLEQIDGIFVLLVICFLFFAHIYKGGLSYFKDNIRIILSPSRDFRYYKQDTAKDKQSSYFLIIQFVILVSISVYDIFWMQNTPSPQGITMPFTKIISFILLIFIFYAIKNYIYKFIAFLFDIKDEVFIWKRINIIELELLSLLYFIPTLLLIYSEYWHFASIVFMAILFIIAQIILFYKVTLFFVGKKFNFLYLIAYLCTIEILPCIFLGLGLIYLYRIDVYNLL